MLAEDCSNPLKTLNKPFRWVAILAICYENLTKIEMERYI